MRYGFRMKKRRTQLLFWFLGVVFALPLGLAAQEVILYAMRTESRALMQAEHAFRDECTRLGLDPNEFSTARRIKSPGETFGFL